MPPKGEKKDARGCTSNLTFFRMGRVYVRILPLCRLTRLRSDGSFSLSHYVGIAVGVCFTVITHKPNGSSTSNMISSSEGGMGVLGLWGWTMLDVCSATCLSSWHLTDKHNEQLRACRRGRCPTRNVSRTGKIPPESFDGRQLVDPGQLPLQRSRRESVAGPGS